MSETLIPFLAALLLAACTPPPVPSPPAAASTEPAPTASTLDAAPPTAATSAAPLVPPSASPPGACPEDMVDVSVACIDRYEAPNVAGVKPIMMANLPDAEAFCAEHGKRLCNEDEWVRACRGPAGLRYPYGDRYDEHACNHDKGARMPRWGTLATWPSAQAKAEVARLDQAEPSGSRPRCVSAEGVHDLTGNVAEWVVRTHPHPEACLDDEQKKHRHVVQGCAWPKCFRAPHEPACDYVNCSHAEGFRSYEFGFRCCKDRGP